MVFNNRKYKRSIVQLISWSSKQIKSRNLYLGWRDLTIMIQASSLKNIGIAANSQTLKITAPKRTAQKRKMNQPKRKLGKWWHIPVLTYQYRFNIIPNYDREIVPKQSIDKIKRETSYIRNKFKKCRKEAKNSKRKKQTHRMAEDSDFSQIGSTRFVKSTDGLAYVQKVKSHR